MFKTAARKIAHNSTIPLGGNKDLRPLQDLINAEKSVLISLQKLSVDFSKASEALRTWGLGEGDDLGDILSASTAMLTHFSSALSTYASHGHTIREHLKAIRTREEALDDLKRRRRSVGSEADSAERKLSKMGPEHKNLSTQTDTLNRLRDEIRTLDTEIMKEEAALGDFKRSTTRTWMGLKFGGLTECCEKGKIVGDYGKVLILRISEEVTQPGLPRNMYLGQQDTQAIVADVHHAISEVKLSTVSVAPSGRGDHMDFSSPRSVQSQNLYQNDGFPPIPPPVSDAWRNPEIQSDSTDYLPPTSGLGTGRFLDSNSPTSTSFINSPLPSVSPSQSQFRQSISINTNPEYSLGEPRSSFPERTLDDFGVISSTSSRIGEVSATPGGRFATFPVKARPVGSGGNGYSLRDDPPSLSARNEHGKSLSETITEALETSGSGRGQESRTTGISSGRFSVDGPAPAYEPFTNIGSEPAPLPPGAAPPARSVVEMTNPWAGSQQRPETQNNRVSTSSDHDALLAYMTSPEDPPQQLPVQHMHSIQESLSEHPERHVRFGNVSDVDDELEKREVARQEQIKQELSEEHSIYKVQVSDEPETAADSTVGAPDGSEQPLQSTSHQEKSLQVGDQSQSPLPSQVPRLPSSAHIQPRSPTPVEIITSPKSPLASLPALSPKEDDERALNAAAAREISRELDALTFNPPATTPESNYQPYSQIS
ncbi:Eisosome component PIL1-domain-containing protein [Cyathus striatus]|nr:Eisosome component PIL1-domain-containing protein [Cyathus striatus]